MIIFEVLLPLLYKAVLNTFAIRHTKQNIVRNKFVRGFVKNNQGLALFKIKSRIGFESQWFKNNSITILRPKFCLAIYEFNNYANMVNLIQRRTSVMMHLIPISE
jgi:hypothetical protein